jgi:enamine deaminase RidA (YjgF/YER057c/UK114 family)
MRPQPVRPAALYVDAPYDYAATAPPGGGLVFTAGACPLDRAGQVVAPGDLQAQARQALDNLLVALAAADSGPDRVLKTTVYVVSRDQSDLVLVWDVVAKGFGTARPPSTLLGVAVLGYTGQLVEIEAVALTRPNTLAGSERTEEQPRVPTNHKGV